VTPPSPTILRCPRLFLETFLLFHNRFDYPLESYDFLSDEGAARQGLLSKEKGMSKSTRQPMSTPTFLEDKENMPPNRVEVR
jgi:hypothetical protein